MITLQQYIDQKLAELQASGTYKTVRFERAVPVKIARYRIGTTYHIADHVIDGEDVDTSRPVIEFDGKSLGEFRGARVVFRVRRPRKHFDGQSTFDVLYVEQGGLPCG